jgi:hypothetical protein
LRKSVRKLVLNRETVRSLEDNVIRKALGNAMPSGRVDCGGSLPAACNTNVVRACLPETVPCATA